MRYGPFDVLSLHQISENTLVVNLRNSMPRKLLYTIGCKFGSNCVTFEAMSLSPKILHHYESSTNINFE